MIVTCSGLMRAEIIECHLEHYLLWPPGYLYAVGTEILQNQRQCLPYHFWNFPTVPCLSHNRLHRPHLWSFPIWYLASCTYSEFYAGTTFLLYVSQRNLSHFRTSLQFTLLRRPFFAYILSYFPLNSDSILMCLFIYFFQRSFSGPHYTNIVLWRPPNPCQFVLFVFIFNHAKHYIPYTAIHI